MKTATNIKFALNAMFLLLAVSFLLPSTVANAEQPNAEVYRKILNADKFYVEYSVESKYSNPQTQKQFGGNKMATVAALVVDGDKRAYLAKGRRSGNTVLGSQSMNNKLFKDALKESLKMDKNKMYLNYLCRDGKCYYFFGKNNALVAPEKELYETPSGYSNIWKSSAKTELSLPHVLEVFAPEFNSFRQNGELGVIVKPKYNFVESGHGTFNGESLVYDKYEKTYTSNDTSFKAASSMQEYIYCYYDASGNLKYVKTDRIINDNEFNKQMKAEQEAVKKEIEAMRRSLPGRSGGSDVGTVESYYRIYKISNEIPIGAFDFPSGLKVYAAESGSLADLTDNYVLVEQH